MVAEHGCDMPWCALQEQISERICEQIVDVQVPQDVEQAIEVLKISSQDRDLHGTVEQIPDILVLETVEQLVKLPETVSDDGVQQRTVEQIPDAPVPQAVEELADRLSMVSFQDGIQQRIVEQTIPAILLAEKIVELSVIQTEERTQQGVNTHAQHIVNTVEVERPEIIKQTGQKPIIQDKINQVTQHVEVPLSKFNDKVVDIPVMAQRQISTVHVEMKTAETPQLQIPDDVIDVPVVLVAQVPRLLVMEKTNEIPQFRAAELLKFNTFKPGDEQISFKEYVNRMKEGQNDISHITDENIDAASSSFVPRKFAQEGL